MLYIWIFPNFFFLFLQSIVKVKYEICMTPICLFFPKFYFSILTYYYS